MLYGAGASKGGATLGCIDAMTILSRYLFKNLIVAFLFSTIAVTAAIWLTQTLRLIDLVVNAGAPFHVFLQLVMLTVPTFLGIVMPVALAGAILFTYNRLSVDSELVVMRASGLSPWALAKPSLLLGGLVTLAVLALNLFGSPAANRELVRLQYAVKHDYASILIREGAFNDVAPGIMVYLRGRSDQGDMLGLLVHDQRNPDKAVTVVAKRGLMADANGTIRLVMEDGLRQEFEPATHQFTELYFDRYVIELRLAGDSEEMRYPDARERPFWELLDPPDEVRTVPNHLRQVNAELHMRLSTPLLPLCFAFIGLAALLSGEYDRRGQGRRLVIAFLMVLALQGLSLGLTGLASKNPMFIPLMYIVYLVPIIPSIWLLNRT